MGYIGHHGIAALHKYKYSGVDNSLVAKYILQPFWSRFVNIFPLWVPPNMVRTTHSAYHFAVPNHTYRFCVCTLVSTSWLYIFSTFRYGTSSLGSLCSWDAPFLIPGCDFDFTIMTYVIGHLNIDTFDAVDGKQARRTNSSSPLGELFDHGGCDALACAFETLAFGSTSMCGRTTFWFWIIAAIPFYCATWEHFFTNTLILPVVNGPTEGLMLIYLCHFLTFFMGAEWWAQDFRKSIPLLSWVPFLPEIPFYGVVLFLMIIFAVIPTVGSNVSNVQKVVRARKGSMLLALAMLFPFILLVGGVLIWCYLSPSDIMGNYPHLLITGTGMAFGFLVFVLWDFNPNVALLMLVTVVVLQFGPLEQC
ncbi:ethanolaminephosphotransferase [Dendrobium catenatum]|uniref:Ethanolaminephosphotransferase n=1 Tax=Dendrobium catenatum TaxID=906689 RepID=A0A2I0VA28_9ASPA|nr:ethanolaminephosphotransferase [Dendrobium catenatum]